MLYAVRITLSPAEWDRALQASSASIAPYRNAVDDLSIEVMSDLLRSIMKRALARHHQWLSERQISAVISPDESGERSYVFYFDNEKDATLFKQEFADASPSATRGGRGDPDH